MTISTLTRWKGGTADDMVSVTTSARELMVLHGAEAVSLSRFHTGPFMGEWLITARYPDWTTYGRAQDGLALDPSYQDLFGRVSGFAELAGRELVIGYEI
ncbi:MAG: hypothetical protein V4653_15730 [Pseudomonadota bacterium]